MLEGAEPGSVPLEVVEDAVGGVMLFVPVHIEGKGPYLFALDTGASTTAIDATVAEDLELPQVGPEGEVHGVTGRGVGVPVEVETWCLGEIELGTQRLMAVELVIGEGPLEFHGLLGSDVLQDFGAIRIDFEQEVLEVDVDGGS